MKKHFILFGALALALGAISFLQKPVVVAEADGDNGAAALLRSAAGSGQYIKKTEIFLNDAAASDLTHFHAGVNTLKRTTYYDEVKGALLMGDFDGTFTKINSGYMNDATDSNKINHFRYKGSADPQTAELFTNISIDWSAKNQRVGGYYPTLSSLADLSNTVSWDSFQLDNLTVWRHYAGGPVEANTVFSNFQFFAAPMLLVDNYITFNSVWIINTGTFLSIRLYADKVDSGKSTMEAGANEVLISEARIYTGISTFTPGDKWYFKGSIYGWGEGNPFEYCPDAYNPNQYKVTVTLSVGDEFKVNTADTWWGYQHLSNKSGFSGNGDSNVRVETAGTYIFYLKPSIDSIIPSKQ